MSPPPAESAARGGKSGWKTPLLFVLATAPVGLFLFILVFMGRYQTAFDEETCPYVEGEPRAIAEGIQVREDSRACQPDVEEHRWVLLRAGRLPLELGRRPLERRHWGDGYRWEAEDEAGRVRVTIHNPGIEHPRMYREPVPEAGIAEY